MKAVDYPEDCDVPINQDQDAGTSTYSDTESKYQSVVLGWGGEMTKKRFTALHLAFWWSRKSVQQMTR